MPVIHYRHEIVLFCQQPFQEVPKTLLLSCCELLILEPKSLQPVYTVGLTDIVKVTTTPLADGFVIIHVKQVHFICRVMLAFVAYFFKSGFIK